MKKIILSLVIGIFTLGFVSCSSDNDDYEAPSKFGNVDLTGMWKPTNIYNSNLADYEWLVLYNTPKDYIRSFELDYTSDDGNYGKTIGNFYSSGVTRTYCSYDIVNYNIKDDIFTIQINGYGDKYRDFLYNYKFRIIEYKYKEYVKLECIEHDNEENLIMNNGSYFTLIYCGYNIMDAWNTL